MKTFGQLCLSIIMLTAAAIVSGLVFTNLWEWFITPAFGTIVLSIPQGIGIVLIAGFLRAPSSKKSRGFDGIVDAFKHHVIMCGAVSGLGWIITLFL